MRWFRAKPKVLDIPEYQPPVVVKPMERPEPGIIVDEIDTSDMTKTGIHKAWDRMTGRQRD